MIQQILLMLIANHILHHSLIVKYCQIVLQSCITTSVHLIIFFDLLGSFMYTLSVCIPIIVLSETWFSRDSVFNLQNYNGYHSYKGARSGVGVSIFVSESIRSSEVPALSINDDVLETCCVVNLKIHANTNSIIINCQHNEQLINK